MSQVPELRRKKGQRFGWSFLRTVIAAAVASDQRTAHAIAQWAALHASELCEGLHPPRSEMPSESTVKRVWRQMDVETLEWQIARFTQTPGGSRSGLRGHALDGKALRGECAHGR